MLSPLGLALTKAARLRRCQLALPRSPPAGSNDPDPDPNPDPDPDPDPDPMPHHAPDVPAALAAYDRGEPRPT